MSGSMRHGSNQGRRGCRPRCEAAEDTKVHQDGAAGRDIALEGDAAPDTQGADLIERDHIYGSAVQVAGDIPARKKVSDPQEADDARRQYYL